MTATIVMVFVLNAISTCLGNLRTVFLSRQYIKPVYVTTFIDALITAYALKLIAGATGFSFLVAFALGRLAGTFLGNALDGKMALGLVEITVYQHPREGILLADQLRGLGFSVTTEKGYGLQGKDRFILNMVVARRHLPELQDVLNPDGKTNMVVKNIARTYGKIGTKHSAAV